MPLLPFRAHVQEDAAVLDRNLDPILLGRLWMDPATGDLHPTIRGADGDEPAATDPPDGVETDAPQSELAATVAADLADDDHAWTVEELDARDAELVESIRSAPATRAGVAAAQAEAEALQALRARREEVAAEEAAVAEELAGILEAAGVTPADGAPDAAAEGDEPPAGEGDAPAGDAPPAREPVAASARPPARPAATPARRPVTAGGGLPLPGGPIGGTPAARVQLVSPRAALLAGAGDGNTPVRGADVLSALYGMHERMGQTAPGVDFRQAVARFTWQLPTDLQLSVTDAALSDQRVDAHLSQAALARPAIVASGGICGPLAVDYTLPVIGSDARPVRDGLPSFQADGGGSNGRGGVRWRPSPTLASVNPDSVQTWSLETDENPGAAIKECVRFECPSELTAEIEALYRCVEMGNFMARFSPEVGDANMELINTFFARTAEIKALQKISAGSTPVSWASEFGAVRDALRMLGVTVVRYRRRHRILDTTNLVWMIPDWFLTMLRLDIATSMPSGSVQENLTYAEAEIRSTLQSYGVRIVEFMDGENDVQLMASAQVSGAALMEWPNTIISYLFAEGTWVYLDGGRLDLGVVRDSALNETNDFRVFAEDFWNVYKRGSYESFKISLTTCPNGASAGTIAPVACGAAS